MKKNTYLICYDIASGKRLNRMEKLMEDYAIRLQYSIYELYATQTELEDVIRRLKQRTEPKEDSVLIIELTEKDWNRKERYGKKNNLEEWYLADYRIC